ncbi:LysR family transcriptional regulator [Halomonas sp. Bachu 37]|uniref:LysR family transcriptional regulator n=1 Tax=Halomonas kashgarensis TaxID=3084920 RepID=UPI0032162889
MHDLDELAAFAAVMESGSLTRSAHDLGLAKSTLSRRISQLETRLGQPLMRRQANRLLPTEAGQMFHGYCRKILELAEQSQCALDTLRHEVSGELEVHVHGSLVRSWLSEVVYRFMDRYPGVNLTVRTCDTPPQSPDTHAVTLWLGQFPDVGLRHETLGWLTRSIYAHPDYFAREGTPDHPRELAHHAWVDLLGETDDGLVLNHAQLGSYRFSPPISRLKVDQHCLHNDALAQGRGLGVLADWLAARREDAHPGCLQRCLPGWAPAPMALNALHAFGHQPRKVTALMVLLREAVPAPWKPASLAETQLPSGNDLAFG